ncbi:hypothetical protein N665_0691s0011 [Sinapis alba]|nr:hypothetical protein N665_0691s0011 [Sinapis alba]
MASLLHRNLVLRLKVQRVTMLVCSKLVLPGFQSRNPEGERGQELSQKELLGLGHAQDLLIPRLREMRKEHFPDILFLMETKQKRDVLVDLQTWLGYDRIMTVNPIGYSGGLALMWKNSVNIDFKFVDKHLVDFKVMFGKDCFFVSCIYGEPAVGNRPKLWERLSRIGAHRNEPWCMLGDFNEIKNSEEKIGGPRRSEASFQAFNDMLQIGDMTELPSTGDSFTWGGQRGTLSIQYKLDRCFVNKDGSNSFRSPIKCSWINVGLTIDLSL